MGEDGTRNSAGLTRRSLVKKGAVTGGLVWAAPTLQTLAAGPAAANSANCIASGTIGSFTVDRTGLPDNQRRISAPLSGLGCTGPAGCSSLTPAVESVTWVVATTNLGSCGTTTENTTMSQSGNDAILTFSNCSNLGAPHRINLKVTIQLRCPDSNPVTICATRRLAFTAADDGTCDESILQSQTLCSTVC